MVRPRLEVGDIFRDRGDRYRREHAGHLSLGQLKVMSAIEHCRTAAVGGHVHRCERCMEPLSLAEPEAARSRLRRLIDRFFDSEIIVQLNRFF